MLSVCDVVRQVEYFWVGVAREVSGNSVRRLVVNARYVYHPESVPQGFLLEVP